MAIDDGGFAEALGAGGSDKILLKRLDHASAHEAGDDGGGGRGKDESREDQMRETPPPSRRQPPERESEDENHQGSGDVGGQRNGSKSGKHRGVVAPSRAVHRSESAEPNTREGREEKGGPAERECDGQGLGENFVHRAVAVFRRKAQVSAQEVTEVAGVLLPEGAIEFVFREELLLDRLGDFSLPIKRPAGRDADEQKSDRDDAKENDDEREQTLGEMGHPAWRVSGFPRPRGDRRCA